MNLLISALMLFTPLSGSAQKSPETVLTPLHVAQLRTVRQAVMSPDGKTIAYVLSVPRKPIADKDGGAWSELHVVDNESGRDRTFISGETEVNAIAWTPDGKGISFLAKRGEDKNNAIYLIAADGGEAQKAVQLSSDILSYSWKHDGKQLALVAVETDPEAVKKRKEKGFTQEIYEEDWKHRKIWIVTPFANKEERKPLPFEGSAYEIEWCPVDDRLAVAASPTPLVDDEYMQKRVYVIDSKTGKTLTKIENPGKLGEFSWSPDGRTIALIAAQDINDPSAGRLMLGDANTGVMVDLVPNHEGDFEHIAWQNADTVMFIGSKGALTTFGKVGRAERQVKWILAQSETSLTTISLSQDGQKACFVGSTWAHPDELFVMNHGESQPRRMTQSNPFLNEIRLAKQEIVRHKAKDGLELEGILIRPLDEKPGTKYPLILVVHGGPEAHIRFGWLSNYSNGGQVAAARGFAVFFPNYRGSTGRGVAFSKTSQGDPAGKEFDDLIDAVDHLVSTGLVDKKKVGVTGGSYGGYATAWCSTRYSEHFAAGVMFVGISDKISKVGTTDIPNEEFFVHALKRPWDNWQYFLERSPIYYAGQCKTPLLILHGKDDPRVNVGQSRELYRHVKLRTQTPVRLVLYPGEGHGNRRAASRYDYNLRFLQWMEHYLKGPGGAAPHWEVSYEDKKTDEKVVEAAGNATGTR